MTYRKLMLAGVAAIAAMSFGAPAPALAQEEIKIGVVTTLTTPAAVIGREIQDGFTLAAEHVGGKIAGKNIKLIVEDDGLNAETGRQKTEKLVTQDQVDFVAGYIWSHVLLASRRAVLDSGKFLISSNAGPADSVGKLCHENFFLMRSQNDVLAMATGQALNLSSVDSAYMILPNYAAGKDMGAGFTRTFKGKIVGQDFTKWGSDPQLDFSAELAKARASGAKAIYAFYPGRAGAFVKQYEQAGLKGAGIDLHTVYSLDQTALPSLQKGNVEGVIGSKLVDFWYPDLDTPENKRFVEDFKKKFGRVPSFYAATAYDVIPMMKVAIEAAKGDMKNMDAIRAAIKAANFKSVRGKVSYNTNHAMLENFYQIEIGKDAEGNYAYTKPKLFAERIADPYVEECKMKK